MATKMSTQWIVWSTKNGTHLWSHHNWVAPQEHKRNTCFPLFPDFMFLKQENIHQHWILWKLCCSLGLPNPFCHLHSSSCCVSPVIIPKHKRSVKLIKNRRHVWSLNLEVVSKKPCHTLVICPISVVKATKNARSVGYDFSASTMFYPEHCSL